MTSPKPPHRPSPSRRSAGLLALVVASAFSGEVATADESRPGTPEIREVQIRRLGLGDGLAQSTVHSLEQDRFGFVWIGTGGGLQRYDGHDFLSFEAEPFRLDRLPNDRVQRLLLDRDGHLWAGTPRGLARLETSPPGFPAEPAPPWGPEEVRSVVDLTQDPDGHLWIATRDAGLARLDADRRGLEWFRARSGPLPSNRVRAVATGDGEGAWVGFEDAAPGRLANGRFESLPLPPSLESPPEARRILPRGDAVWMATSKGILAWKRSEQGDWHLVRWLRHERDRSSSLASDDVRALLFDRRGRLWAGTALGLALLLGDPLLENSSGGDVSADEARFWHFRHRRADPDSLSDDRIETLMEDASGLIWVGTALGGVNVLETRPRFTHVRPDPDRPDALPARVVRAFAEDPSSGRLWVGTDGGGLAVSTPGPTDGSRIFERVEAEPRIWSLHLDRDGRHLWVGGESALHRLSIDSAGPTQRFTQDPGDPGSLGPGAVRALSQDADGRLWIGHFGGGLSRLDRGGGRFERFRQQAGEGFTLTSDLVLTLYHDRRDSLWIGTASGLARWTTDGRFHSFQPDPDDDTSLYGDMVHAIHQDTAGNLWIGTDAGLNRLPSALVESPPVAAANIRGFSRLSAMDGLPRGAVLAILEDASGQLWLAGRRGLCRFDPESRDIRRFGPHDGLQGHEFTAGAAWSGTGRLYFGGLRGYNVFSPTSLEPRDFTAPVRFTAASKLRRDGELSLPLPAAEPLRLGPGDVALAVEFATLDFASTATGRYVYRLERPGRANAGDADGWQDLGSRRRLTLTGLDAGDHRLVVRGSTLEGSPGDEAKLLIRVVPPTWWSRRAQASYVIALIALGGWLAWQNRRRQLQRRRLLQAVQDSERRLDLAIQGSGDGVWDWDLASGKVFRSGIAEMLGFEPERLPADHSWRHLWIEPRDRGLVERAMEANLRGDIDRFEAEYRVRDAEGRRRWILDRGTVVRRGPEGEPLRMAGTFKDMTARKEMERELRLWSTVFEAIDEGVVVLDAAGRVQAVNEAFCRLFGRPRHSLLKRPASRLQSPYHAAAFYRRLRRRLIVDGSWRGEMRMPRSDGGERLVWMEMRAVEEPREGVLAAGETRSTSGTGDSGPWTSRYVAPSHYVAVVSDITRRKRAEEELRYLADYDPLTGLPNRSMFSREAAAAVAGADADGRGLALLFGDLDQFKQVNDTLGHAVGDQLLQEAARRLLTSVRTDDLVARLGGDELVVLLHDPSGRGVIDRDSASLVARRILDSFAPPMHFDGHELTISASLGLALFPDDGEDIETLLKHADIAMYEAKSSGRNQFCFFSREMSERALLRIQLEDRLRQALSEGELELLYQPIFDLRAGRLAGVEALLRWPQPEGEAWRPERFLEVAEETGLIVPIGAWVVEEACRQAVLWSGIQSPELEVCVNISPPELLQPGFAEVVGHLLSTTKLEPTRLTLELTEGAVIERAPTRGAIFDQLSQLGVRLSIDDFGTGFSSLGHLRELPIDELKIDRSFVHQIADRGASPIARTILAMAEGLGVSVVAEGVESEEQLEILARLGCHRVQGHLICPPRLASELTPLLTSDEAPWRDLRAARNRRP